MGIAKSIYAYSQTPLERISRDWTPFSVGSGLPLEPIRTMTLTFSIRKSLYINSSKTELKLAQNNNKYSGTDQI